MLILSTFSQSNEITEPLTPLIQVASLLQTRKETDQDVSVILDICSTLSTAQVIKVTVLFWLNQIHFNRQIDLGDKIFTDLNMNLWKRNKNLFGSE